MIQIDFRDSRPIYEQIKEGMRRLITTGAIRPDEKIPSVRELASTLAINPNTIQRAYRELEQEGYLYKVTGRGTFAAEIDPKESVRYRELLGQFDETVRELCFLGVAEEELMAHLKRQIAAYDGENKQTGTFEKQSPADNEAEGRERL